MNEGRNRNQRSMLVAQAALVWATASPAALNEFVETGELPGGQEERMPYDPAVAAEIAKIRANGGRLIIPLPSETPTDKAVEN